MMAELSESEPLLENHSQIQTKQVGQAKQGASLRGDSGGCAARVCPPFAHALCWVGAGPTVQ